MFDELTWLPAWEIRDLIVRKEVSAVEVTTHFLERIAKTDPQLHAFITVVPDLALKQAWDVDHAILAGQTDGSLLGVPVSIKDMDWVKGIRTTAGSLVYQDHIPIQDSVLAERVRSAGAIIIGKTNTPEFGLAARTVSYVAPECLNPWDPKCTAGGSSGGAAASVRAGMNPLAIGSDAGGSIRIPAAFCGVFGLLPSNGRVPRYGAFGGTLQFGSAGPLTNNVRDAALLLQVLAWPDRRDPTCRRDLPPDYLAGLEAGIEGVRVGWTADFGYVTGVDTNVVNVAAKAAESLQDYGARLEHCSLTWTNPSDAMTVINAADAYALNGQALYMDKASWEMLTPYARERYSRGRKVTGVDYVLALKERFWLIAQIDEVFEEFDLIASPTVGFVAPRVADLETMRMPPQTVAFTEVVNFVGYSAATVPAGLISGLPVGLQLIARPNEEDLLLRACRVLEQAQPWNSPKLLVH